MFRLSLLIPILITIAHTINGQNCNNANVYKNWVLGYGGQITFNDDGSTTANTEARDGISQREGLSTVSNNLTGELKYYADGSYIYNADGSRINTTPLGGSGSSLQTATFVPHPTTPDTYFFITSPDNAANRPSNVYIVDGSTNTIVNENNPYVIESSSSERVTAVRHCNAQDYWLINQERFSENFTVTHINENSNIDASGNPSNLVSTTYSITELLPFLTTSSSFVNLGQISVSPDNSQFAYVEFSSGRTHLLNFDNSTGEISYNRTLDRIAGNVIGVAFSPNGRYLYVSTFSNRNVVQYDLVLDEMVGTVGSVGSSGGQLALGPNGHIYFATFGSSLAAIETPDLNLNDPAFVYDENSVEFSGRQVGLGLPTLPPPIYVDPPVEISGTEQLCQGSTSTYSASSTINNVGCSQLTLNFIWSIIEGQGVLNNTNDNTVDLTVEESDVKLVVEARTECGSSFDTLDIEILELQQPQFQDTVKECFPLPTGSDITLNTETYPGNYTFVWQDNSTNSSYITTEIGTYTVTVANSLGCSISKSVVITSQETSPLECNLVDTLFYCPNETISEILNPGNNFRYLWNTNSITPTITAISTGDYTVTVYDECNHSSSCKITLSEKQQSTRTPNLSTLEICTHDLTFSLTAPSTASSYSWSDGLPSASSISLTTQDWIDADSVYDFTLTSSYLIDGCTESVVDIYEVSFIDCTPSCSELFSMVSIDVSIDTLTCLDTTSHLDIINTNTLSADYTWLPSNEKTQSIDISEEGIYTAIVKINTCEMTYPISIQQDTTTIPFELSPKTATITCIDSIFKFNITSPVDLNNSSIIWSHDSTLIDTSIFINGDKIDSSIVSIKNLSNHCLSRDTLFIEKGYNDTIIRFNFDTTLLAGETILLPLTFRTTDTVVWFTQDYLFAISDTTVSNPLFDSNSIPNSIDSIIYEVQSFDKSNPTCITLDSIQIFLIYESDIETIGVPTAFTPNNDTRNDYFTVLTTGIETIQEFKVFNRWGEALFEQYDFPANDNNYGWDGTYRGVEQNIDTFIFQVVAENKKGETIVKEGQFSLIR